MVKTAPLFCTIRKGVPPRTSSETSRDEAETRLSVQSVPGAIAPPEMSDVEALRIEMDRRLYHFQVVELRHNTNKDFRIKRLVVPFANGQMWLPLKLIKTRIVDPGGGRAPEAKVYDAVHELVEDELMLYTGDQGSIPHDDMIDCMADLTDEEVMARFTPPEGGMHGEARGGGSRGRGGLFAR